VFLSYKALKIAGNLQKTTILECFFFALANYVFDHKFRLLKQE